MLNIEFSKSASYFHDNEIVKISAYGFFSSKMQFPTYKENIMYCVIIIGIFHVQYMKIIT